MSIIQQPCDDMFPVFSQVNDLAGSGGSNLHDMTRRLMQRCFSSGLLQNFSFEGARTKMGF